MHKAVLRRLNAGSLQTSQGDPNIMHLSPSSYRIDPTPRRADGEYMAHARISAHAADGSEADILMSGDLAGFELRDDAVRYAIDWANAWLENRLQAAPAGAMYIGNALRPECAGLS
jgi:hypothetical protein